MAITIPRILSPSRRWPLDPPPHQQARPAETRRSASPTAIPPLLPLRYGALRGFETGLVRKNIF